MKRRGERSSAAPGGPTVIVPGGDPMELTATGSTTGRGPVLILHDSNQPAAGLVTNWTREGGRCLARTAGAQRIGASAI